MQRLDSRSLLHPESLPGADVVRRTDRGRIADRFDPAIAAVEDKRSLPRFRKNHKPNRALGTSPRGTDHHERKDRSAESRREGAQSTEERRAPARIARLGE